MQQGGALFQEVMEEEVQVEEEEEKKEVSCSRDRVREVISLRRGRQ